MTAAMTAATTTTTAGITTTHTTPGALATAATTSLYTIQAGMTSILRTTQRTMTAMVPSAAPAMCSTPPIPATTTVTTMPLLSPPLMPALSLSSILCKLPCLRRCPTAFGLNHPAIPHTNLGCVDMAQCTFLLCHLAHLLDLNHLDPAPRPINPVPQVQTAVGRQLLTSRSLRTAPPKLAIHSFYSSHGLDMPFPLTLVVARSSSIFLFLLIWTSSVHWK